MSLRHYLVSGHVQGVGFRRFIESQAEEFELSGIVRNLEDGRVEVYAKGSDENLDEFERAVRRGPMHSAVRDVVSRTLDKPEGLEEEWKSGVFTITGDGLKPWVAEKPRVKRTGAKTNAKTEPKAPAKATTAKSTQKAK